MRVIVTGSRKWANSTVVYGALAAVHAEHGPSLLVHGDCSTGADFYARHWVEAMGHVFGWSQERFPANWARGLQAGPERNRRMIEAGADLVLAFPLPEGSGTQHTMRLAREAGIEVREFKDE